MKTKKQRKHEALKEYLKIVDPAYKEYLKKCGEIDNEGVEKCKHCGQEIKDE